MATKVRSGSAFAFVLIGMLIYAGIDAASEYLLLRNGHANPLFKISATKTTSFDWVILGASHAMPLDFGDFNDRMQQATGLRIINLASPGTGPLYNRFVLEAFLAEHSAGNLLYVVDSFAFYSRTWNEDRFGDAKLLRTSPLSFGTARLLARYCWNEGVDVRSLLDYASGFSKINNRDRFQQDHWEGELQWDRVYRTSASATRDRIAYLYPTADRDTALARYMRDFAELLDMASQRNVRVTALRMPVPATFRAALPDERAFEDALLATATSRSVRILDLSASLDEPRFYFDTDHLNRTGTNELFERFLKAILTNRLEANEPASGSVEAASANRAVH